MKLKTQKKICLIIFTVSILTILGTITYAFLPPLDLPNEPQNASLDTATLKLRYTDCAQDKQSDCANITANLKPGDSVEKTFEVTNVGTLSVYYSILFRELNNTFKNNELVYSLENTTSNEVIFSNRKVLEGNYTDTNIKNGLYIEVDETVKYKITFTFLNTDYDQTDNKDAEFNIKLKISEGSQSIIDKIIASSNGQKQSFAATATTNEGIFEMEDDYGTSYYYRGAVENNYVKFGKNKDDKWMWWRIIRINGDGSMRIQYDGVQTTSDENIYTRGFTHINKAFNSNFDDTKYVGWMYGPAGIEASTSKAQAQSNIIDSDIKKLIDQWYKENILNTGYSTKVSDTLFCNDRAIAGIENSGLTGNTGLGYGTNITGYSAYERLGTNAAGINYNNPKPTFKCREQNDAFTTNDKIIGNAALTYPIALITADEIVAAGSRYGKGNSQYYLNKGAWYWSITPFYYADSEANMFGVFSPGDLYHKNTYSLGAIAPVINLSPEYADSLIGSGTIFDPYQLS